jgi:hypothetical protein
METNGAKGIRKADHTRALHRVSTITIQYVTTSVVHKGAEINTGIRIQLPHEGRLFPPKSLMTS